MTYQKIEVTAKQRRNLITVAKSLASKPDVKAKLIYGLYPFEDAGKTELPWRDWELLDEYYFRVFGVSMRGRTGMAWRWLFSSFWSDIDPTYQGATARIVLFLTRGVPTVFCEADGSQRRYLPGTVDLYRDIPSTWPEIIAAFPELQLPPE